MHYNFEVQPCNPYSGHEKETLNESLLYTKQLVYDRPDYGEFSQLAQWLEVQAMEDRETPTL